MTLRNYYATEGDPVPRLSLSTVTQYNLNKLEELGFLFSDTAWKTTIQRPARGPWKATIAYSYLIPGTIDEHTVEYERRETRHPSAGQTLVWIDGKKYSMTHLLDELIAGKALGKIHTYYALHKRNRRRY